MSEVVPLPSFGEVFFDARGQERCLRVTWHEGTLVLSLWRGEMCTASFRMPMEDVGRLLDTLDEGFAEATGEQPAVPAHDPGTEVIPGTGQYQRPQAAPQQNHQQQPVDDRPTAALSPNDVLVARGPAPQDKLVASYGETTAPRDATPAYGDRGPFTGPQYVDPSTPQPQYNGDSFSGPQYTAEPSQYQQQQPQQSDLFSGPQYADKAPVYQFPGADQRHQPPLSTDPLGFPSQAADPYGASPVSDPYGASQAADSYAASPVSDPYAASPVSDSYAASPVSDPYAASPVSDSYTPPQHRPDPHPSDPYASDPFSRRQEAAAYAQPQQPQPQPQQGNQSGAGLGTPMHGIPGAGRRRAAPQQQQPPARDDYAAYQQPQQQQPNPVDPLLALGRQEQYQEQYQPQQQQPDPNLPRTYQGDPMFSTGERLRPEQPDYHQRSDRREW
ncbi:hypothetical protein [Nonomuraea sp. NPDC049480]|uniref:hypothetical protein n=1 Tax=Nonomuraea sp. NPDC049480 TaxID=3364353 RepID=UPI0037AD94C8